MKLVRPPASIPQEEFDDAVRQAADDDNGLYEVPGIWEIISEHYNNEAIEICQRKRDELLDNLVVLDVNPDDLRREDLDRVMKTTWYEAGGIILIDNRECPDITETEPEDVGGTTDEEEVHKIDDVLKRCSSSDGFYHV